MPRLTIDGKEIVVPEGTTVIQACEMLGIEIPKFCYHERLMIAGNCRMCLVEMERSPKPIASCAQPCMENMVIKTDTEMVRKAREGVMEFLLINHPLDCPICDQGGECDLQDQALFYGKDSNRFDENKRTVRDKYMGPLIKTHMTRCIHCTRCVRFLDDVAGTQELGAIGRGEDMEITTYIESALSSELSGNIIDLCPVGALTSKPYAFKARSWELKKTESIDVLDAVGSNIRIDSRGNEVMRILPRVNEDINEEWLADKSRFSYDGLKYQRLDAPIIKQGEEYKVIGWDEALSILAKQVLSTTADKIGAIAGDLTDVETMLLTKEFLQKLGSNNYDCRQDGSLLGGQHRVFYLFNTQIKNITHADVCLIVGSNPRHESPVLNARIRKAYVENRTQIALIGEEADLSYPYRHLSNNPWVLKQIADGEHPFCEVLKRATNPMIIVSSQVFVGSDLGAVLYNIKRIVAEYNIVRSDWNGYNTLQRAASRVGGYEIGFLPNSQGKPTFQMLSEMHLTFLLGADEIDFSKISKDNFIVYIGHHGDNGSNHANLILPGAAYTEKEATYVNLEGKAQSTNKAVFAPGEAMEDWQIIANIAKMAGLDLGYANVAEIRRKMQSISKTFANYGEPIPADDFPAQIGKMKYFTSDLFIYPIKSYYMTDVISRNSKTMAKCVEELSRKQAA